MKKVLFYVSFIMMSVVGFAKIGSVKTDSNIYHNSRFDFKVEVPQNFSVISADNGDGITVTNDEKEVKILVYGTNMVLVEDEMEEPSLKTLKKLYEYKLKQYEESISYKNLKKEFFEISYMEDDNIIYEKVFYNKTAESMCYYYAEYSPKYENEVKKIVMTMANSFK